MKTELLIPVGNKECLEAAIKNGADAVYLGGKKFGARAFANNFDDNDMVDAIKLCHNYGVKIYVTVNTMVYNHEIEEVLNYLKFLYRNNVDAIIMQDIGLINLTRKLIPELVIHVSTQAHNHNYYGLQYYKDLGCKRVVLDRETSLDDINDKLNPGMEIEVFVYGALCVCYSGNCLFSYLDGGRSANRGMCAQCCRLPYKLEKNKRLVDSGYLLSTKDLNTLPRLKDILDKNITSLKVEGRMKSKEYVAIVTKTFRRLIDDYYSNRNMELSNEDNDNLKVTFNRKYTLGYLFNEKNIINKETSNHQGIKIGQVIGVNNKYITIKLDKDLNQGDAIRFKNIDNGMYVNSLYDSKGLLKNSILKNNICMVDNKDRVMYDKLINSDVLKTIDIKLNNLLNSVDYNKINIFGKFVGKLGSKMVLELSDGINKVYVEGSIPEKALKQPISKESIFKQISKLGDTIFNLEKLDIDLDDNLFINIKDLNELRRECIDKLIISRSLKVKNDFSINIPNIVKNISNEPKISVLVRNEDQFNIVIRNNINTIYTTNIDLYNKYKDKYNIYLRLDRVNDLNNDYINERLLCTELGSINKYKDNNDIRSDYYLNIMNDYSIDILNRLGCKSICLSIEGEIEDYNQIKNKYISELIVYGNIECMIIKNNIFDINNEECYLINNKNNKYKVLFDNYTHIFNYKKYNIIDKLDRLKGFNSYRIELLDESIVEVQKIINDIKSKLNM